MRYDEIYDYFKEMMPEYGKRVMSWSPNGYNSIKLRLFNHNEYVFTMSSDNGWRFETVKGAT